MGIDNYWGRKFLMCVDPYRVRTIYGGAISDPVEVMIGNVNSPTEWRDSDESQAAKEGGGDIRIVKTLAGLNEWPIEPAVFARASNPVNSITEVWTKLGDGVGVSKVDDTTFPTASSTTDFALVDSSADFVTDDIVPGDIVLNRTTGAIAEVTLRVSATMLFLHADIMSSGNEYNIAPEKNGFWVAYNNPFASGHAIGSTFGRNNVWNAWEFAHHFNELATGNMIDSTGNGHDATPVNMDATNRVASINNQGYSQTFIGGAGNEYMTIPNAGAIDIDQDFTLMARGWVDVGWIGYDCFVSQGNAGTAFVGIWGKTGPDRSHYRAGSTTGDGSTTLVGAIYKVMHLRVEQNTEINGYFEGALDYGPVSLGTEPTDPGSAWQIGRKLGGADKLLGRMTELRFQQGLRDTKSMMMDWDVQENPQLALWNSPAIDNLQVTPYFYRNLMQ